MTTPNAAVSAYLGGLSEDETLIRLDWDQWLDIGPPHEAVPFAIREVTARYARNGYDWDIHGRVYTPAREVDENLCFLMMPGGFGNEYNLDITPDGRPGIARVLAGQGFKVLALSYPGLYPPGGTWDKPTATRLPHYLLDQELSVDEIHDRMLKCTFNTTLQGVAKMVEEHLAGREILAYGHSTAGPMAAHLHRFIDDPGRIKGLAGFGSGGPDGWRKEWREITGLEDNTPTPMDALVRRTPEVFLKAGYDDPEDLCPWSSTEEYIAMCEPNRSNIHPALCNNQHRGYVDALEATAQRTGLPVEEYTDHLGDPDPAWLQGKPVLLLTGEN
ncbi:MAG: hypothetical protein O7E53_02985, partial [Alphaproteobacteria bacterium]|nr:hypothetical protein [Alphaproteobacteria bacterium]